MSHSKQRIYNATPNQMSKFAFRLALASLLCTAICLPALYQPLLSQIWRNLYNSRFYRFSGFETILTASCYILIEPFYTYKFGHNADLRIDVRSKAQDLAKARPHLPKMRRPRQRIGEILIYVAPLLLLDFTLIKKFADVPVNEIRVSGGYAPIQTAIAPNVSLPTCEVVQGGSSTFISPHFLLPTLHNFALSSPLQLERAIPFVPPTSRRIVLELMGAFFIYDALFFAIHIAFHYIRPLARIHNPHHTHAEMHPQVTNRLSIAERLSLILLANFALNIIRSHVFTRTCFVPLFVYLLIEVHCGMDLDWGYEKLMPSGWGAGPRIHAEHHRTGRGSYAPFFRWWDVGLMYAESARRPKIG